MDTPGCSCRTAFRTRFGLALFESLILIVCPCVVTQHLLNSTVSFWAEPFANVTGIGGIEEGNQEGAWRTGPYAVHPDSLDEVQAIADIMCMRGGVIATLGVQVGQNGELPCRFSRTPARSLTLCLCGLQACW